jgi:hypothetical protein
VKNSYQKKNLSQTKPQIETHGTVLEPFATHPEQVEATEEWEEELGMVEGGEEEGLAVAGAGTCVEELLRELARRITSCNSGIFSSATEAVKKKEGRRITAHSLKTKRSSPQAPSQVIGTAIAVSERERERDRDRGGDTALEGRDGGGNGGEVGIEGGEGTRAADAAQARGGGEARDERLHRAVVRANEFVQLRHVCARHARRRQNVLLWLRDMHHMRRHIRTVTGNGGGELHICVHSNTRTYRKRETDTGFLLAELVAVDEVLQDLRCVHETPLRLVRRQFCGG